MIRTLVRAIVIVATFGAFQSTLAADDQRSRVVLYKLAADKELEELAATLGESMLLHAGKNPRLIAIGEAELAVMVRHEKDKTILACEDQEKCLGRVAELLQAEKVVTGRLGRLGNGYVVTLKLADTNKKVIERVEAAQADSPKDLIGEVEAALDRLLGTGDGTAPRFVFEVGAEGSKAAVVDLAHHGVPAEVASNLTQLLTLELKRFEGLDVISRDEIQTMLRFEAEKMVLGCESDTACLVEIGGALGVDFLVTGSVGKLGKAYVVNLKLMDVARARVVNRGVESFEGVEADLPLALRFATLQVLGTSVDGTGSLMVKANVAKGSLALGDGSPPVKYPLAAPMVGLKPGKHGVSLTAEGHLPLFQETYLMDGEDKTLRLRLQPLPKAWYEEWWTWTIIGGVLTAGAIAALVLIPDDARDGTVGVTID